MRRVIRIVLRLFLILGHGYILTPTGSPNQCGKVKEADTYDCCEEMEITAEVTRSGSTFIGWLLILLHPFLSALNILYRIVWLSGKFILENTRPGENRVWYSCSLTTEL